MAARLLDRQAELLEYLTSGEAIFGNSGDASLDRSPFGIDHGLLHLEARYSHEKRAAKIEWVLRRTFDLLGSDRDKLLHDFAEACPPVSIGRLENARQFHDFLLARWRDEAPEPAYLPDLASFELAYAAVQGGEASNDAAAERTAATPPGAVRRHRSMVLLCCAYDIREVIEGRIGDTAPARRDMRLAIAMLPGAANPVVCALSSEFFEVLEALDEFVDPAIFQGVRGANELIMNLAASGIIEVSR